MILMKYELFLVVLICTFSLNYCHDSDTERSFKTLQNAEKNFIFVKVSIYSKNLYHYHRVNS